MSNGSSLLRDDCVRKRRDSPRDLRGKLSKTRANHVLREETIGIGKKKSSAWLQRETGVIVEWRGEYQEARENYASTKFKKWRLPGERGGRVRSSTAKIVYSGERSGGKAEIRDAIALGGRGRQAREGLILKGVNPRKAGIGWGEAKEDIFQRRGVRRKKYRSRPVHELVFSERIRGVRIGGKSIS